MPIDQPVSPKHPADKPAGTSKRRKHHRHRRHRTHRHRSKRDHERPEQDGHHLSASNSRPDDEKEEGEILEEDEEESKEVLKTKMKSDEEFGEVNPGEEIADSKDDREVPCGKGGEEENNLREKISRDCGNGEMTSVSNGKVNFELTYRSLPPADKDCQVEKNELRFRSREKHQGEFSSIIRGDMSQKLSKDVTNSVSKSPAKGTSEQSNYKGVDSGDSRRNPRSRSPLARESLDLSKNWRRDVENFDSYELRNNVRSVSPHGSRGNFRVLNLSPNNNQDHDEVHARNNSTYQSHVREKKLQSRNDRSTSDCHGHDADQIKAPDSVKYSKMDSNCERGTKHSREDWHGSRDRGRDVVIDRVKHGKKDQPSHYCKYSGDDDGHNFMDVERDRDQDRGSYRVREMDKERERNSRYTHRGGLGREDMNKERGWKRYYEREQGTDKGRERCLDRNKEWYRNKSNNNYSRSLKYDGRENFRYIRDYKDRLRSKESKKELRDLEEGKEKVRAEIEQENYEERVSMKLAEQEEEVSERIKESRKQRLAIQEKYKQQQLLKLQVDCLVDDTWKGENSSMIEYSSKPSLQEAAINVDCLTVPQALDNGDDSCSSEVYVGDSSFVVGKSPVQSGTSVSEKTPGAGGLGEGTPKSERSTDMFCDDIDDIFGESPAGFCKPGKTDNLHADKGGLRDNWDDAEGYYSYRFGEVLDGRYEITAAHGKGVYSSVVRAKDLKAGKNDPQEVAVKIIRNNETMYKAGLEESIILKKLVGEDPEDKRHCVRFLSNFKYRNHLCLVFESLYMNLREVLKKFGRNIGLKLTAVRAYAKQLFIALKHLRNCGILHCDIKPDNMLVNEAKNCLKLCDFGNAMFAEKNEITPYLVSRFYRAPEIILGLAYDHPMDMWSVGCCLYELHSGKVLFPASTNNDMLRLHMELRGPFPKKMLRKGAFADQHFDQDLNFHGTEEDPVTKKTVKRLLLSIKPKDIGMLISSSPGEDPKMISDFKDLLERIFVLDPEKRIKVSQALSHPFITGK